MTTKQYTVVGISTQDGNSKVRFTNDISRRVKVFMRRGAERVDFIELPHPMMKLEALHYMLTRPEFASPGDQHTIKDAIEDREARTRPKLKKVTKAELKAQRRQNTSMADILSAVVETKDEIA